MGKKFHVVLHLTDSAIAVDDEELYRKPTHAKNLYRTVATAGEAIRLSCQLRSESDARSEARKLAKDRAAGWRPGAGWRNVVRWHAGRWWRKCCRFCRDLVEGDA